MGKYFIYRQDAIQPTRLPVRLEENCSNGVVTGSICAHIGHIFNMFCCSLAILNRIAHHYQCRCTKQTTKSCSWFDDITHSVTSKQCAVSSYLEKKRLNANSECTSTKVVYIKFHGENFDVVSTYLM